MKVLMVNSSARKDGNTALLINVCGGLQLLAPGLWSDAGGGVQNDEGASYNVCSWKKHGISLENVEFEGVE